MAASKKTNAPIVPSRLAQGIAFLWGPGRTGTLLALLVAAFAVGAVLVWQHVRPHVMATGRYTVTLEQVEVPPPPGWIHSDIRAEVFRNASLDPPLSLLDESLGRRIFDACKLHPWVAKVNTVTPQPDGRVIVDLVYRRPVCVVEVPGDLLPVDVEGVLLPVGEFPPVEKQSYPCLAGIETLPVGPPGHRWGDIRVVEGAQIAATLGQAWQQLKLYRIQPVRGNAPTSSREPTYELFTRAGTKVYWGMAPSSKAPGEIPAEEKVSRLLEYAAQHGSLEGANGPQVIDVRQCDPAPRQDK